MISGARLEKVAMQRQKLTLVIAALGDQLAVLDEEGFLVAAARLSHALSIVQSDLAMLHGSGLAQKAQD